MKNLIFFAVLLVLSGCAVPHGAIDHTALQTNGMEPLLKKITLTTFGTTRFSGLIALAPTRSGLRYTLLDPMGVTLVKAQCGADGTVDVQGGVPRITESKLPRLLAQSLSRIYLIEPAGSPCSTGLFTSFCRRAGGDCQQVKYLRRALFLSWKVCYADDKRATIIYTRPWAGLTLTLADINEDNSHPQSGDL